MSDPPAPAHIAPDDPDRQLTVVSSDDPALQHVGVVGDTYTVLVTAEQTAGRYAMLDMLIPPNAAHRRTGTTSRSSSTSSRARSC